MALNKRARKKRLVVLSSLVMCCLAASLLAAAYATEYWFESDANTSNEISSGKVNFGLFKGRRNTKQVSTIVHTLRAVCLDGYCMYSCADTKEHREDQLRQVMDNEPNINSDYCSGVTLNRTLNASPDKYESPVLRSFRFLNLADSRFLDILRAPLNAARITADENTDAQDDDYDVDLDEDDSGTVSEIKPNSFQNVPRDAGTSTVEPTEASLVEPEGLMNYGLWVSTIVFLSLGLLMAVVGALFAVINTATTPVEAITGVPGLYLWNGLAAVFDVTCVSLWAAQFHIHLSKNVLLYDVQNGWTTEGMEVFGYSFWLVVVAIFVHIANITIIFIGTYEPKIKEQLEAPETKGGNIMLY